jgi:hypothetical protein
MRKTTRKLNLGRETVRMLGVPELAAVGGGGSETVHTYGCGIGPGSFQLNCDAPPITSGRR